MANRRSFNDTVAARCDACEAILGSEGLMAIFEAHGGLRRELEAIIAAGRKAEACNAVQKRATVARIGATAQTAADFAKLRREHKALMAVLKVVRFDIVRANPQSPAQIAIDYITRNDAQLIMVTVPGEEGRRGRRSRSYEAVSREIGEDAACALKQTEICEALASRKFDRARLEKLVADAQRFSYGLSDKTMKLGSRKSATIEERAAVKEQSEAWSACYRILAAVGRESPQFAALLSMAAR